MFHRWVAFGRVGADRRSPKVKGSGMLTPEPFFRAVNFWRSLRAARLSPSCRLQAARLTSAVFESDALTKSGVARLRFLRIRISAHKQAHTRGSGTAAARKLARAKRAVSAGPNSSRTRLVRNGTGCLGFRSFPAGPCGFEPSLLGVRLREQLFNVRLNGGSRSRGRQHQNQHRNLKPISRMRSAHSL